MDEVEGVGDVGREEGVGVVVEVVEWSEVDEDGWGGGLVSRQVGDGVGEEKGVDGAEKGVGERGERE
ncbi:hypothetical protein, partial [Kocuria rosea]|uniref:hypothetical protein n=1 Tax=Kocuria rosea TaxID=1275 RepID=UPI001C92DA53